VQILVQLEISAGSPAGRLRGGSNRLAWLQRVGQAQPYFTLLDSRYLSDCCRRSLLALAHKPTAAIGL